jgi:hypothetical protein
MQLKGSEGLSAVDDDVAAAVSPIELKKILFPFFLASSNELTQRVHRFHTPRCLYRYRFLRPLGPYP